MLNNIPIDSYLDSSNYALINDMEIEMLMKRIGTQNLKVVGFNVSFDRKSIVVEISRKYSFNTRKFALSLNGIRCKGFLNDEIDFTEIDLLQKIRNEIFVEIKERDCVE